MSSPSQSIPLSTPSQTPEEILKEPLRTDCGARSAPQADVAHELAGGTALCRREVDLAAGANTHLIHGLFLEGLTGRCCVGAKREAAKLNAVCI